ncbi:unnamed protein product [Linum trigynum]|uniref:S1 motif domain-containing protein n=1 Tax=Linum trigynum TaxID=586398 RepID=A0AAV2DNA2_9ROSI
MDTLALANSGVITAAAATTMSSSPACSSFSGVKFSLPRSKAGVRRSAGRRRVRLVVSASREGGNEPQLDEWDEMELKFGRYLAEDPKLTIAKMMARKVNPDASFLEVEKEFHRNKGKLVEIEELPFDIASERKKNSTSSSSLDGLSLTRPVLKQGMRFQEEVSKPARLPQMKKPIRTVVKDAAAGSNVKQHRVPDVILRKPCIFGAEDGGEDKDLKSRVRMIQPNLMLKMRGTQRRERFSDMTLLRKPEAMSVEKKQESPAHVDGEVYGGDRLTMRNEMDEEDDYSGFTLLQKPVSVRNEVQESSEIGSSSLEKEGVVEDKPDRGIQQESINLSSELVYDALNQQSDASKSDSESNLLIDASLQGKPNRLDQSVKERSTYSMEQTVSLDPGTSSRGDGIHNLPATSPVEAADWSRAEELFKGVDRAEVELISSSARGFIVSFGSLVGFLPYRNLAARWKFIAFESWVRQKGLDPSAYKQNLGIIEHYDSLHQNRSFDRKLNPAIEVKTEGEITPDMKLEDLLRIYDQEKLKFLSSFVGQKIKANVVMANKKSGKLLFSLRPKEKEELAEKKRTLMTKLQVGDVVKGCIKKITYFGVFVEVEGVPALIHQTEVSWDATLDPASYFKLGQIVEAKVHQLDFTLERIFLSLKEITPDPLTEAWESVIGDRDPLSGSLQPVEEDTEWVEVESLIKELEQTEGIQSVTKGRYFLSPGLAPTFQVYMASMFEDQYKLLARAGNKVQEVIVQSLLDKEEMKSVILSCANKV